METHNPDRKYPHPCTATVGDTPCTKKFQRKTDLDRHYDSVSHGLGALERFRGMLTVSRYISKRATTNAVSVAIVLLVETHSEDTQRTDARSDSKFQP